MAARSSSMQDKVRFAESYGPQPALGSGFCSGIPRLARGGGLIQAFQALLGVYTVVRLSVGAYWAGFVDDADGGGCCGLAWGAGFACSVVTDWAELAFAGNWGGFSSDRSSD